MCIHAALLFKAETQLQIHTAFLSDKANTAPAGCPFWPSMKQSFPGLLTLSPQNRRALLNLGKLNKWANVLQSFYITIILF